MVRFTETVIGSAQTALTGGQMTREDVLAGAAALSALPFNAVEVMNPALSQTLVTRLAECPFERIRMLRKVMPKATLLLTLDARCGLGQTELDAATLTRLIQALADAGVDRFRLSDREQSPERLAALLKDVAACKKEAELVYCLNKTRPGTPEALVTWHQAVCKTHKAALVLSAEGGALAPKNADTLFRALKAKGIASGLSLCDRSGLAVASGLAAAAAGADFVDTALAPFAGGASFPATEVMAFALGETIPDLKKAGEHFELVRRRLVAVIARDSERPNLAALGGTPTPAQAPPKKAQGLDEIEKAHGGALKRSEDALLVAQYAEAGLALVKGDAKPKKPELAGARAYDVEVDGESYHVQVHPSSVGLVVAPRPRPATPAPKPSPRPTPAGAQPGPARPAPTPAPVARPQAPAPPAAPAPAAAPAGGGGKAANIPAPMQGTLVRFLVKVGDRVERAGKIAILEAMKMENDILSPTAGTVVQILVQPGEAVQSGQNLVVVEP